MTILSSVALVVIMHFDLSLFSFVVFVFSCMFIFMFL